MKLSVELAIQLICIEKTFLPGQWQVVRDASSIVSGLSAPHKDVDRLEAKIRISHGSSDKVSFTMLMRVRGEKQRWRVYALDWNPTSPHRNPFLLGHPDSYRLFSPGQSHEHHIGTRVSDENPDKFALSLAVDLPDYDSALAYFCDRMNIRRPPDLAAPEPQGQLL